MIDRALLCVVKDVNEHFHRLENDGVDRVALCGLVNPDGTIPNETEGRVAMLVTCVEEEKNVANGATSNSVWRETHKHVERAEKNVDGASINASAPAAQILTDPIHLNVHVMVAAMHKRYDTGLGMLSAVIACLREKPVFNHQNTPGLDPEIERLMFNMMKMNYSEMSHLWSGLGAKYVPSALYTMRMLTLGQRQIQRISPEVARINVNDRKGVWP